MTRESIRTLMKTGVLGLSLVIVPLAGHSFAQSSGGSGSSGGTTRRRDDGFNMGWLGLLGLAGLMPKKTQTVTTHRTGDTTGR